MDLETIPAGAFGRSLTGIGVNQLGPDVRRLASFLTGCFGLTVHRLSADFAIVRHGTALMQRHGDATYGAHPLLGLVPEMPPRGAGGQFYLFGIDPDAVAALGETAGGTLIEAPADKPHGLREATILSPEGYACGPAVVSRDGAGASA